MSVKRRQRWREAGLATVIARRLRAARLAAGLEAAAADRLAGLPAGRARALEVGDDVPMLAELARLAAALGVSVSSLTGGEA